MEKASVGFGHHMWFLPIVARVVVIIEAHSTQPNVSPIVENLPKDGKVIWIILYIYIYLCFSLFVYVIDSYLVRHINASCCAYAYAVSFFLVTILKKALS